MEQQWHWPPSGEGDGPAPPDFAETCFCPCIVYSRALARLKAAYVGQNPQKIPSASCIENNCCDFMLCLPFWGFSIARLQATVRSYYDIKGKTTDDWRDGWCCPCVTLQRSEYEILIREKERQRRYETPSYTSQSSMIYLPSNTVFTPASNQQSQRPAVSGHPASLQVDTAPASALRQAAQGNIPTISITSPSVVVETKSPSLSVACVADPSVASGLIIQPEHGLHNDATVAVAVRDKSKEHLIDHDSKSETSSLSRAAEHRLEDHAGRKQPTPKPEHAIVECTDGTTSPRPNSTHAEASLYSMKEILHCSLEEDFVQEHPPLEDKHTCGSAEAKVTFCGES